MSDFNTKMTAIADEIRELSSTTDPMGLDAMATHIGVANSEIVNQTDLIIQLISAVEGKSGNGSVKLTITNATVTDDGNGNVTIG